MRSCIMYYAPIFIISISGMLWAVDLGESCPPCTKENSVLQEEYNRLQTVIEQKNQHACDAQKLQSELKESFRDLLNTKRAKEENPSSASLLLYQNAVQNYDRVQREFKTKLAALASIMVDVNGIRKKFVSARQQLNECEARVNPGLCKKCENGIIQTDDTQNTGNPCTRCSEGEVLVSDKAISFNECAECMGGDIVPKPDGAPVMGDPCMECQKGSVASKADGIPCDDGDPCTINDRCVNGVCIGDVVTSNENPDCP